MPRNEDGEMELVLGNRQLLSVLFILVVLMGVFFTMGYIVGRNNPSEEKLRAATKQQIALAGKLPPTTVDPPSGGTPKPSPAIVEPAKPEPAAVEPPKPEPVKPEPAKKEETKKKEEAKQKKAEPPPPPPPAPAAKPSGELFQTAPAAGMYLQVSATDKPGAAGMAEAYRRQGFPVVVTPSSSAALFRVLVGPMANNQAVADMKTKLKGIGVDGTILRKF